MKSAAVKQALNALALGIEECDYAARGYHLSVTVPPEQVVAAAEILDREGFFLEAVTGVDWLGEQEALAKEAAKAAAAAKKAAAEAAKKAAESGETPAKPSAPPAASAPQPTAPAEPVEDSFEVVYDFNHYPQLCRVVIRTRVPRHTPQLPTISQVYPGANWHERETHDFFGIVFEGHPDLSPFLLPEDADFHPLRKDYQP
ncbi:NADH-quinone oxidoreductase subunit C [Desulfurivibrio sp. D14AmB]|uniref:NADH-quinone oxidoreductase subunit C n=1 Tax=Desulfurivibrio sp. D14AmB TaxID=3374370 RepID=UPI00376F1E3A